MNKHKYFATAALASLLPFGAPAAQAQVKTVFVIAMENHDWIDGGAKEIFQNPNAPFINSLVAGTSALSPQVAFAAAYHNVLATPTGQNPHIHPSEPNYIWAEAGTNFGRAQRQRSV
ncbi:MAG: hypothetical protein WDN04_20350 [Rhodospirillales bacterium]